VSSSGNDDTCVGYSPDDENVGADPFNPISIVPCATYVKAYSYTHNLTPDWILMKRGDSFVGSVSTRIRNGRSAIEPFLVGAYGDTGVAPIFKVPADDYAIRFAGSIRWLAVSGITFYAYTRDPESPDYVNSDGVNGLYAYANDTNVLEGVLFEGCKFIFFLNNQISGATFDVNVFDFQVYRCLFTSTYSETSHSQGLFSDKVNGLVLEENIFDHNGWLIQSYLFSDKTGGQATMFNHNTYISSSKNVTLKNNIFSRPSSMQNKFTADLGEASGENITIENNLYIDGEGVVSMGGNTYTQYRFKGITIDNNVVTNLNISHPTNRNLAYGIEMHDWDGGVVTNNYIINTNETNSFAFFLTGTSRNVSINNNIVYGFQNNMYLLHLENERGEDVENMSFTNNVLQVGTDAGYTIDSEYDTAGKWTILDNKYFSNRTDGHLFRLLGVDKSNAQWATATGDNSTFEQVAFPNPNRSIETYMQALGETATIDTFIGRCRAQDRYNWDKRYTAEYVNWYIKSGFSVQPPKGYRLL